MRHRIIALLIVTFSIGTIDAQKPDTRSVRGVFGEPQPHGEIVDRGFIGLYSGRTNLHFGQAMRLDLFAVSPTIQGPNVDLPTPAPLKLTDAKGEPIPFRLED